MTEDSSQKRVTAVSVDLPEPNKIANVQAMFPGANSGKLCFCRGTAPPPEPFLSSLGVRALCRPVTAPEPTELEMFSYASTVFPNSSVTTYPWANNNAVNADCEEDPQNINNVLYVMSSWIKMASPGSPISEWKKPPFKGKRVQSCTSDMAAAAPYHDDLAHAAAAPNQGFVDSAPWENVGGWLEYRHLAVDQFFGGNRLLYKGRPLKAHRIAVSAFDVTWQYGPEPTNLISRSVGELATAPVGWLFVGLPQASIVVWQLDLGRRRVVISECSDKPDILSLDPNLPIFVQVNFAWADIGQRAGAFGLRVRVID